MVPRALVLSVDSNSSYTKHYSLYMFSQLPVCYLNNLSCEKSNKSTYDNKYICNASGPDLLLKKDVLKQSHIYSKELKNYIHGSNIWTDTNQMNYRSRHERYKNRNKYMLGNFLGINEYEIGHSQEKHIYIYFM